MTPEQSAKLLTTLVGCFPTVPQLAPEFAQMFHVAISGFPPETCARAAKAWVLKSKWFPSIAEFVEECQHHDDPWRNLVVFDDESQKWIQAGYQHRAELETGDDHRS